MKELLSAPLSSRKLVEYLLLFLLLALVLSAAVYGGYWYGKQQVKPPQTVAPKTKEPTLPKAVQLEALASGDTISSPLTIKGTVLASWMFEGVFPIKLLDNQRKEITRTQAEQAIPGDWSSGKERVAFKATLTFSTTATSGYLVFRPDSGKESSEDKESFEIPVKFSQAADETMGWKTFKLPSKTGESCEFKYPADWIYVEASGGPAGEFSVRFGQESERTSGLMPLSLLRVPNYWTSVDDWFNKVILYGNHEFLTPSTPLTVGGVEAKELVIKGYSGRYTFLLKGKYAFSLGISSGNTSQTLDDDQIRLYEVILSTFRFIE